MPQNSEPLEGAEEIENFNQKRFSALALFGALGAFGYSIYVDVYHSAHGNFFHLTHWNLIFSIVCLAIMLIIALRCKAGKKEQQANWQRIFNNLTAIAAIGIPIIFWGVMGKSVFTSGALAIGNAVMLHLLIEVVILYLLWKNSSLAKFNSQDGFWKTFAAYTAMCAGILGTYIGVSAGLQLGGLSHLAPYPQINWLNPVHAALMCGFAFAVFLAISAAMIAWQKQESSRPFIYFLTMIVGVVLCAYGALHLNIGLIGFSLLMALGSFLIGFKGKQHLLKY